MADGKKVRSSSLRGRASLDGGAIVTRPGALHAPAISLHGGDRMTTRRRSAQIMVKAMDIGVPLRDLGPVDVKQLIEVVDC